MQHLQSVWYENSVMTAVNLIHLGTIMKQEYCDANKANIQNFLVYQKGMR